MKRVKGDTGLLLYNVLPSVGTPPIQLLAGRQAADVKLMFFNKATKVTRQGDGIVNITSDANGLFVYQWSATDLGTVGIYECYPVITTANGPAHMIPQILEIVDLT